MEFSEFERAVIGVILSESVAGMDVLRQQFAAASVVDREYTGIGFYTRIAVPRSLPPVSVTIELGDQLLYGASGHVKSEPNAGISFHLQTDGGYLACLEGVVFGAESWPDEDDIEIVPTCIRRPEHSPGRAELEKPHGRRHRSGSSGCRALLHRSVEAIRMWFQNNR